MNILLEIVQTSHGSVVPEGVWRYYGQIQESDTLQKLLRLDGRLVYGGQGGRLVVDKADGITSNGKGGPFTPEDKYEAYQDLNSFVLKLVGIGHSRTLWFKAPERVEQNLPGLKEKHSNEVFVGKDEEVRVVTIRTNDCT